MNPIAMYEMWERMVWNLWVTPWVLAATHVFGVAADMTRPKPQVVIPPLPPPRWN